MRCVNLLGICMGLGVLLLVLGGCGEKGSPPTGSGTSDSPSQRSETGTETRTETGTEANDRPPQTDVEPVRAKELYQVRAPADVLADVRAAAKQPTREALRPDARWQANVTKALFQAGLKDRVRPSAFEVAGGRVEAVETAGAGRADPWVRIERWQGDGPGVLKDRAALYVTPSGRPALRVERIDLDGMPAYRSYFDDPKHPTLAWMHRSLFVRFGAADEKRAAALHAALEKAGAYSSQRASPETAPDEKPQPGDGTPDPLVGLWTIGTEYTITVQADGAWSITKRGQKKPVSGGTWRAEGGTYELASGTTIDLNPATARIESDGTLRIEDDGQILKATRKQAGTAPALEEPVISDKPEDAGPVFTSEAFPWRLPANRSQGPDARAFDGAVEQALAWLAAHQSPNGGWEAAGFHNWCNGEHSPRTRPAGPGKAVYDPGVTGLALCAFLGAGYTNRGKHPYAKVVSRGLRYLKNIQDPEGCYGPRSSDQYVYNHAICALAMVEIYGMTESPIYKGSAQVALDFIGLARNPYFAWRYGIKPGDNDTSVSGWMMLPLKSAQLINERAVERGKPPLLSIDEAASDGMKAWLNKVTDPDYGRIGYVQRGTGPARPKELVDRFPGAKSEAMTALGMLMRIFMGEDPRTSKVAKLGAGLLRKLPPVWNRADGSIDMIYWYYGTLAMYQVGGEDWTRWKKALARSVLANQRGDTDYCAVKGSWDPIDPWGRDGGRVYSTALLCLCCQARYRYERAFGGR